ncbi:MAG: hypothetical protein DI629_03450 [Mesorhizobium amorphae]|nr:MAG: hypothetical protein DI629_03450 [Mesorhizobium amorphae]
MTLVDQFIERLTSATDCPFSLVERAGDLAIVKERPNALPAAYVLTLEEASARSERMMGGVLQRLESDLGVILVTENVADAIGSAASADVEQLKIWTRRRLIGFVPDAQTGEAVEHISGKLLRIAGGCLWWGETFGVASYLEEGVPA